MDTSRVGLLFPQNESRSPSNQPDDPLIPFPRAAAFWGVTPRTLERWRLRPELDFPVPIRIGTRRYLRMSQIARWTPQAPKAAEPPEQPPPEADQDVKAAVSGTQPEHPRSPGVNRPRKGRAAQHTVQAEQHDG